MRIEAVTLIASTIRIEIGSMYARSHSVMLAAGMQITIFVLGSCADGKFRQDNYLSAMWKYISLIRLKRNETI